MISEEDILVEALWPKREGGQHVGVSIPAIKVTHLPSGLIAIVETESSQHRNRQVAIEMIIGGLTCSAYQGR